uniref:Huntingtin-interacting protein 1 n=1 Tax=Cacopsylla melanoneura TaxID=428564 RepID=A0A8D8SUG0_9HEMI
MSSLSLPRVLQPRKTSLELERETFEKFQSASIGKAVNSQENPVKEKHVRNAILGTFHDKSSTIFWQCASRLPLMENVIVAWKFCHVLHKILREGHPNVIKESIKQAQVITNVGKMWFHLKDGYGKLIYQYTRLLLGKLDFHRRNPGFPGNLVLSQAELDRIGDNDINNYFQMSVEMFDYLDEILALQAAVFGSLDMSRSNSMTSSGQCRLSPLIPCIQDSSQLYDFCVKILFKLHAALPSEILAGHRSRFMKQFSQLRQFYMTSSTLQYFKQLIQVPTLPETPPNLLVQAELGSYVTPVVMIPEPPPTTSESSGGDSTPTIGELVDLSHNSSSNDESDLVGQRDSLIEQRDSLIEQLQRELSAQRRLVQEQYKIISQLRESLNSLEMQLATKDSELNQEKQLKDDLLRHTEAASLYHETEKKLKAVEEKFTKLKDVYTKLREEHITLIRQKAGIEKELRGGDKMVKFARAANQLICSIKADVDKQLASVKNLDLETDHRSKLEEELSSLQCTAEAATEQNEALVAKIDWIVKEKSVIESEVQDILTQKNELDVRLKILEEQIKTDKAIAKSTLLQRCKKLVEQTLEQLDSPKLASLTCTPEYLAHIRDCVLDSVKEMPGDVITCVHNTVLYILLGKATSNTAPDIDLGERMSETCKSAGKELSQYLTSLQIDQPIDLSEFKQLIGKVATMSGTIKSGENVEVIGDLVENELAMMDKAIEEAATRIEEMLTQSRKADTGLKLEVNGKILDSCTTLMSAIRVLVQKSRLLQAEIIQAHHGSTTNSKEFYKRNHQWTEGLISAAKAVAMSAKYLLTAADQVVSGGEGVKLERLIVASHGVAASTAQLVVASRVKADRNSGNLAQLSAASREVTHATGSVVATAKTCIHLVDVKLALL